MRLRKQQVDSITNNIVEELSEKKTIKCADTEALKTMIRKLIMDDLMVEDKLNEEVHKILHEHSSLMKHGSIEYHKMFRLVKEKLAKDRNIIL